VPAPAIPARTTAATLPTPAPPSSAPVPAAAQAPAPTPIATRGPASTPPQREAASRDAGPPPMAAPLDEKAKRLADFFNGEVIEDYTNEVA
jgi:DNA polymerase-3 subunit gamma/tau